MEEQIEKALVQVLEAAYQMFLALNMDKDVTSYKAEGMKNAFAKIEDMVKMRWEFFDTSVPK